MTSYLVLQLKFLFLALFETLQPDRRRLPAVPSPRLRHRVHGSADTHGYLEVGKQSWASIEAILKCRQRAADEFQNILDFGCGSGRVLRNIEPESRKTIWGADIDASAIRWCQKHLPGYRFATVDPLPPTGFDTGAFDLILAISVFTHLDEARQNAWLAEISRLLQPGGVFIASVHGEHHRALHSREVDLEKGFRFNDSKKRFFKKDGLPRFYQDAHHTKAYVVENWSRYFNVLDYIERGIVDHHDAVVLTK